MNKYRDNAVMATKMVALLERVASGYMEMATNEGMNGNAFDCYRYVKEYLATQNRSQRLLRQYQVQIGDIDTVSLD